MGRGPGGHDVSMTGVMQQEAFLGEVHAVCRSTARPEGCTENDKEKPEEEGMYAAHQAGGGVKRPWSCAHTPLPSGFGSVAGLQGPLP